MRLSGVTVAIICTILIATAAITSAATKGRILTNGKVTMYKNGKAINSFTKQGPIDDSALIACEGNCLVKVKGISLIAEDKSRFAIKEVADSMNLYVEAGRINFAVSDLTREFSFYSPGNYYVKTKGFITSAATAGSAKGFMQVEGTETRIAMEEGTMIVDTDEGSKTIGPGQSILLAMAEVPEEDDNDDKAAAVICPFFSWGCKSGVEKIAFIGSGAALAAGITILVDELNDDDTPQRREAGGGDDTVVTPPPSPSPNR